MDTEKPCLETTAHHACYTHALLKLPLMNHSENSQSTSSNNNDDDDDDDDSAPVKLKRTLKARGLLASQRDIYLFIYLFIVQTVVMYTGIVTVRCMQDHASAYQSCKEKT